MRSRLSWVNDGPASPFQQALITREPGLPRRRLAALIRSMLSGFTFGAAWTHPKWNESEWRLQRVHMSRFQSLAMWANTLLPLTSDRITALGQCADINLAEACALISLAIIELDAVDPAPKDGRIVHDTSTSFESWKATPAFHGKSIVEQLASQVQQSPPRLLGGLLLHGSASDGHVCPGYSDLDLHAVISTPRHPDDAELLNFLAWMMQTQSSLHRFNPFCHHGVMLVLDLERRACPEIALPSAVLHRGVWLTTSPGPFTFVHDTLATLSTIAIFEPFFENAAAHAGTIRGPFDAIWWTSSVLLLPLLLWPLLKGESIYKRDGLPQCNEVLAAQSVCTLRRLEELRVNVGRWIERHPQPSMEAAWSGATLHQARERRFTESDRHNVGFDEELLLAGRKVWEETIHLALHHVQTHFPDAVTSPRQQAFFSWPSALTEHPRPLAAAAYDSARAAFLDRARGNSQVTAVYEFGKIGSPGLSDLDFLVVLASDAHGVPAELLLPQLPPEVAEIMGHDALFISEEAVADFPGVFALFDFHLIYAAAPTFVPALARTFELPRDHVAPILTRVTAFKYPHDLIWLMRLPNARWKTLLAYLNSFNHVAGCLSFLGIPLPDSICRCTQLNAEIRHQFSIDATATTGDLVFAMDLMLDASVDAIFSLEDWWRQRYPALNEALEPSDSAEYRAAVFECLAVSRWDFPTLPAAIRMVLRRCIRSVEGTPDEPPVTGALASFHEAFEPYAQRLRRFLSIETTAGRIPNSYIHRV
jgi:hypothetical protein